MINVDLNLTVYAPGKSFFLLNFALLHYTLINASIKDHPKWLVIKIRLINLSPRCTISQWRRQSITTLPQYHANGSVRRVVIGLNHVPVHFPESSCRIGRFVNYTINYSGSQFLFATEIIIMSTLSIFQDTRKCSNCSCCPYFTLTKIIPSNFYIIIVKLFQSLPNFVQSIYVQFNVSEPPQSSHDVRKFVQGSNFIRPHSLK